MLHILMSPLTKCAAGLTSQHVIKPSVLSSGPTFNPKHEKAKVKKKKKRSFTPGSDLHVNKDNI